MSLKIIKYPCKQTIYPFEHKIRSSNKEILCLHAHTFDSDNFRFSEIPLPVLLYAPQAARITYDAHSVKAQIKRGMTSWGRGNKKGEYSMWRKFAH